MFGAYSIKCVQISYVWKQKKGVWMLFLTNLYKLNNPKVMQYVLETLYMQTYLLKFNEIYSSL